MEAKKGRVTIPTNLDVVKETLDIMDEWGADAIRDCDGTEFPQELKDTGAKIYATYYTTRKDNAWAKANLLITIENSYRGKLAKGKGEELRTTKTDTSNHGIGLPSVRRAADKYQGVLSVDTTEPGRFLARVVLYGS